MVHAKNDETVTKFVKVMPRILWPLFFPDTVYLGFVADDQCHLLSNDTLVAEERITPTAWHSHQAG